MKFDLDAALRWLKPHRKQRALSRRPERELDWVDDAPLIGAPVLLDATVYIDLLQGRSPPALDRFIAIRTCNHSSVAVSELTHAFGRLDPRDKRSTGALRVVKQTIDEIPPHRLSAPDADMWSTAGVLAGLLFRLGSFAPGAEYKCLNDVLLFLQARKLGMPFLTSNIRDFDFLNQLVPDSRVLFYRKD